MADTNATQTHESDSFELYRYTPSIVAAVIFVILFGITSALHTYQLLRTKTWYFIPFVIGGYFQVIGYIGRSINHYETPDWTLGPFIIQSIFLLVAPALYAASIYMELGHIIRLTDGHKHSLIPVKWLTKLFVCGDIMSFLAQSAGTYRGGIMGTGNAGSMETGETVIIVGLVLQILFFGFFIVVGVLFHFRLVKRPTKKVSEGAHDTSVNIWKKHLYALYGGSILILVRSLFRLIEYIQGNDGYLISNEVFLYVFDSLLMLATMIIFNIIHPSEIAAAIRGPGAKVVMRIIKIGTM